MKKLIAALAIAGAGLALTGCGDTQTDRYQREMELGANCIELGGYWYWQELKLSHTEDGRYVCEMYGDDDMEQELPPIEIYEETRHGA